MCYMVKQVLDSVTVPVSILKHSSANKNIFPSFIHKWTIQLQEQAENEMHIYAVQKITPRILQMSN